MWREFLLFQTLIIFKMDPVIEEAEEQLSLSDEGTKPHYQWSLSSSPPHENVLSDSLKMKSGVSFSHSAGASASFRKHVSFAESTPLVGRETSTVVLSYDNDSTTGQDTTSVFIKERPLRVLVKERKTSFFDRLSVSVQHFGETTHSMAHQRATIFHTISLPDIPSDDRRASAVLTVLNILGMSYGISTLALPYIVAQTGILGIVSIILLGALSLYTALLLVDCQYQHSKSNPQMAPKRIYRNFIDVGNAAFPGKYSPILMKALVFSSLLSDVYIFILMGQATSQLGRGMHHGMTYQHWILVWLAALIPTFSITRVSVLAWISFASLISFIIVVVLIYGLLFSITSVWSASNLIVFPSLEAAFVGYGIILNSYNLHWYVPAMEASMKKPEAFPRTMCVSLSINTLLKTAFGIIGAATFGALTHQSIVENLQLSNSTLRTLILVVLLLAQYFYFPMGLYVVFEMFDLYFRPYFPLLQGEGIRRVLWLILSRALVLTGVVFLAVSFSQFGFVVGAIGSLRGTLVAVVFPCLVHLKLKWKRLSLLAKCTEIFLIVISSAFGIGGTYYSAKGMVSGAA